jgi:hypothetical protein
MANQTKRIVSRLGRAQSCTRRPLSSHRGLELRFDGFGGGERHLRSNDVTLFTLTSGIFVRKCPEAMLQATHVCCMRRSIPG